MKRATIALLLDTLQLQRTVDEDGNARLRDQWMRADVAAELTDLLTLLTFEGAELWFYRRAKLLALPLHDLFMANLRRAAHQTSLQNMRADAQTVAVITMLTSATVPWALIKGQARRAATTLYPFADARSVSDVDLLVPEARAKEAWTLLLQNGFRRVYEGPVDWTADHHQPVLIDVNGVGVELHTTTAMSVTPAEAWRRATEDADPVHWSGMDVTVPNATELLWQALAHTVADGTRGFQLRSFLSISAVLAASPSIDWMVIGARITGAEVVDNDSLSPSSGEQIKRALAVSASLAGTTLPPAFEPRHPLDLIRLLQWRAKILRRSLPRAVRERLLEEALRAEAQLPITPAANNKGPFRYVRRRCSSAVARIGYVSWRAIT